MVTRAFYKSTMRLPALVGAVLTAAAVAAVGVVLEVSCLGAPMEGDNLRTVTGGTCAACGASDVDRSSSAVGELVCIVVVEAALLEGGGCCAARGAVMDGSAVGGSLAVGGCGILEVLELACTLPEAAGWLGWNTDVWPLCGWNTDIWLGWNTNVLAVPCCPAFVSGCAGPGCLPMLRSGDPCGPGINDEKAGRKKAAEGSGVSLGSGHRIGHRAVGPPSTSQRKAHAE